MKLFLLSLLTLSLSFTGNWISQPVASAASSDWSAIPKRLTADTSNRKLNKAIRKTIRDMKRKKLIRKPQKELPGND